MQINDENYANRLALAEELISFQRSLEKVGIASMSIGTIGTAIKQLKDKAYLPLSNPLCWGYSIKGFKHNINVSNSLQYPKKVKDSTLEFSIEILGNYQSSQNEISDPFEHLEFNLVVISKSRKDRNHILSYHLDRDIKGGKPSPDVHPDYHFQMGGRKLESFSKNGKNFGNKLILDAPRFMHYPMDFIIGLDFALSNFDSTIWRKLRREPAYVKVLLNAQERTLKPFVMSLAHHFGILSTSVTKNNWRPIDICPQIVK